MVGNDGEGGCALGVALLTVLRARLLHQPRPVYHAHPGVDTCMAAFWTFRLDRITAEIKAFVADFAGSARPVLGPGPWDDAVCTACLIKRVFLARAMLLGIFGLSDFRSAVQSEPCRSMAPQLRRLVAPETSFASYG